MVVCTIAVHSGFLHLQVLRGFAEVVEVTYLNRDGSPSTDRRDSSLPRDRRGSELPQAVDGERLRVGSTASVQGRHFTVTTKVREKCPVRDCDLKSKAAI